MNKKSETPDMTDRTEPRREDYSYFQAIPTRFSDNDMLGHLNNVSYNRLIETVCLDFLMNEAGVSWDMDPITFAVESLCQFRKPISYPAVVDGCFRIGRIGTSSVRYEVALFEVGDKEPAAVGHFIHVFVDRKTERPVPIPDRIRKVFEKHLVKQ